MKHMIKITVIFAVLLACPVYAQELDPLWQKCQDSSECIAVGKGYCHIPSAINKIYMEAFQVWNKKEIVHAEAENDGPYEYPYCKPTASLNQGIVECRSGLCVWAFIIAD